MTKLLIFYTWGDLLVSSDQDHDQDISEFWLLLSSSSSSSVSASPSCSISWSFWCHSFSEKRSGVGWKDREPKDICCENSNSWYPEAHIPWLHKEVKCLLCSTASSCWRCKIKMNHIDWFAFHQHPQFLECSFHLYNSGVWNDLFLVQQRSFLKLCKDTGLLNDSFTAVDADLIFAKAVDGSMEGISSSLLKNFVGESNQRPHIKWENERYITSL